MTVPTLPFWTEPINDGFGTTEVNNREYWRYEFAGRALQGLVTAGGNLSDPQVYLARRLADTLLAELEVARPASPSLDIEQLRIEQLRVTCLASYSGGYRDRLDVEIFRHGMKTVFNVLRGGYAAKASPVANPEPSAPERSAS